MARCAAAFGTPAMTKRLLVLSDEKQTDFTVARHPYTDYTVARHPYTDYRVAQHPYTATAHCTVYSTAYSVHTVLYLRRRSKFGAVGREAYRPDRRGMAGKRAQRKAASAIPCPNRAVLRCRGEHPSLLKSNGHRTEDSAEVGAEDSAEESAEESAEVGAAQFTTCCTTCNDVCSTTSSTSYSTACAVLYHVRHSLHCRYYSTAGNSTASLLCTVLHTVQPSTAHSTVSCAGQHAQYCKLSCVV